MDEARPPLTAAAALRWIAQAELDRRHQHPSAENDLDRPAAGPVLDALHKPQ